MNTKTRVHGIVSKKYGEAVNKAPVEGAITNSRQGWTGNGKYSSGVGTLKTNVGAIGYEAETLFGLPEGAVRNSFGCGNPLAFSGVKEGDRIVDLGSGAGLDLLVASKAVGHGGKVIGIDMTDEMIEKAKQNIQKAGVTNVEVKKAFIEKLPIEDSSIDWVISNCVINLSPEIEQVFSEIERVLKPGGQMQISDIVANDLPPYMRWGMRAYGSCVSGAWSEVEYKEGLRKAGLEDIVVRERLVYNNAQLKMFIKDLLPNWLNKVVCFQSSLADLVSGAITQKLSGRIWSSKFYARKKTKNA